MNDVAPAGDSVADIAYPAPDSEIMSCINRMVNDTHEIQDVFFRGSELWMKKAHINISIEKYLAH